MSNNLKKIIVCPDSFKGSLSATEVSETISTEIKKYYPKLIVKELPLADGGEGTAEILSKHLFPIINKVRAQDPLGRYINVKYYTDPSETKVFIESANIIGLPLLKESERNPLITSSFGLGEVIAKAIVSGGKEVIVSLGGSATVDGGKGMLEALKQTPDLNKIKFKILCDVENPLIGEKGAVNIFALQKGAKLEDLPILEKRMIEYVNYCKKHYSYKDSNTMKPGAGAAGGLGFTFQTIFGAETIKGIDYILQVLNFEDLIKGADLIITGEGKIDLQSLMGKVITGVLKKALPYKIPVIALCGQVENKEELIEAGIREIFEISDPKLSTYENMKKETTVKNLQKTVLKVFHNNIF